MRDPIDDVLASWLLEVPSFSGRPILDHPLLPLLPHEGLEGLVYALVHGLDNRSTAPRDDDYIRLACLLRDLKLWSQSPPAISKARCKSSLFETARLS